MTAGIWICRPCLRRLPRAIQKQWHRPTTTTANTNEAVSPTLLSRARATAQEHTQLTHSVAASFDHASAKRIGELSPITAALTTYDAASDSVAELHSLLHDPTSDAELRALANADLPAATSTLAAAAQTLTAALLPAHPFAHLPCLIELRPGVGGNEAALFTAALLRMYRAYCASAGLRAALIKYERTDAIADAQHGADAPITEAILEVDAPGAYAVLRCEAGVHRVQRVPATESKGRVHTSAASVLVLPAFPIAGPGDAADTLDPSSEFYVNPADVRVEVMRSRGAGGQHVNTTDSAVRLTHMPTGTVVAIQDSRSQPKNKEKAWQVLRARLAQRKREEKEEEALALRRSLAGGVGKTGRGDKIRTYNWGQQRVTDHRSGITLNGQLDDVLEGGAALERVMDSVRKWMMDVEIEGLLLAEEQSKGKPKSGKR